MSSAAAYKAYLRTSAIVSLQYRVSNFAQLALTVLWILLLTRIWAAVYTGHSTLGGFDLHGTIVYITLASLQALLLNSSLSFIMSGRVRDGSVVFDLSRPIGLPGQMLALEAGSSAITVLFILLAAPFAALAGALDRPAGLTAGAGYLLALVLGWVLNSLIALGLGLTAFWTVSNQGFDTLFRFVAAFLAGSTVPLTFFPGPLRAVADLLPFQFIVYQPAAIYVGQIHGTAVLRSLGLAVLWIAVLSLLVGLIWRQAHQKVAMHGG